MDAATVTENTHLLSDLVYEDDNPAFRGGKRRSRKSVSKQVTDSELTPLGSVKYDDDTLIDRFVHRVKHFFIPARPALTTKNNDSYTVEEAIEYVGFGPFQIKIFLICGLFQVTDALEMLMLAVLSPALRCAWNLPDWKVALTTTVVFFGAFFGSNIWGSFGDKFGRLPILKLTAFWIGFYGVISAASPFYSMFVSLRALVGFGYGGSSLGFTLFSEYLPMRYRAKMLLLFSVMWAMGSQFEVVMSYLILPSLGWRALVAISSGPMFITVLAIWLLPESARYLLAAGRKAEAVSVLERAATANHSSLPTGDLTTGPKLPLGRFRDLFRPGYIHVTLQIWLLWFGCACSYYGIILAQSELLERGGVCDRQERRPEDFVCPCRPFGWDEYSRMMIATMGEFVAIPLNMLFVDVIGRKRTLVVNFALASCFFLLLQMCTTARTLTVFIFGARTFSYGVLTLLYIYTSELFPTVTRGLAVGSSASIARTGAMLTPLIAQVVMNVSPLGTIWFYGSLCAVCCVAAIFLPVETMGKGLTQAKMNE